MNQKFKEWFREWTRKDENTSFCNNYGDTREGSFWVDYEDFQDWPISVQIGIYLDFFLSHGQRLWVKPNYGLGTEPTDWSYMCNDKCLGFYIEDDMLEALKGLIVVGFENFEK